MFNLEKLKESYCGDLIWFEELENQMKNILHESRDYEKYEILETKFEKAFAILDLLKTMNCVIITIETSEYVEEYYEQALELYVQMKYDLTTILGINEFWEII